MAKKTEPKIEEYSTSLRVNLTTDEVADRANRAAHKLSERDAKEADLKAHTKHAKGVIEALDAELRLLSSEVRQKATYRLTDCERRFNYDTHTVSEVRLDTGEVLHERKMTDSERQMELPFTNPKQE